MRWSNSCLVLLLAISAAASAQSNGTAQSQGSVNEQGSQAVDAPMKASTGVLVDQVIAVVNGDLVLESDVEQERRFSAFQPYTAPEGFSRDEAIKRLIDRDLILQQARLQPDDAVTAADAQAQLDALRKEIPRLQAVPLRDRRGLEGVRQGPGLYARSTDHDVAAAHAGPQVRRTALSYGHSD